jgi:hypothetical protein
MEREMTEMNVYQKLNVAREEFHQASLKKTGFNKYAGYYYFDLGDFVIPALSIFKKHGLASVISFGQDHAHMDIINVDKPEEKISIYSPMSTAALKGCHEVQNLGAVQTYIRRYLWVAALEIVEHDALDSTTGSDNAKETTKAAKVIPVDKKTGEAKASVELQSPAADKLFADSMIQYSSLVKDVASLNSYWKANQGQLDKLKLSNPDLYENVRKTFSDLKQTFSQPKE